MSHEATNWAIKQRGLKPAAKIVLWHLCDRYHPDNGCFPSQKTLADDCEMSRSALNHWLDVLDKAKLISRVTRRNPKTQRQERTEYHFPFEEQEKNGGATPSPESGLGSVSGESSAPSPDFDESRVRNPDSNLVKEPVREPVKDRERDARASGQKAAASPSRLNLRPADDDRREIAFQRFLRPRSEGGYPAEAIDDVERARTAWGDIDEAEWDAAVEAVPRFLRARKDINRSTLVSLEKYIRNTTWRGFPPPKATAGGPDPSVNLKPWTRPLWALLARRYEAGKSIVDVSGWLRNGMVLPTLYLPSEDEEKALVAVMPGTPEAAAWVEHFQRLGAKLPVPDAAPMFLPSLSPKHLSLRWKGYRLIQPASIEIRSAAWWWRLYVENAPIAEMMAERGVGRVEISMGPIALPEEADAMVRIDVEDETWPAWELWFLAKRVRLLPLGGFIYAPARHPYEAFPPEREAVPDYEALEAMGEMR